MADSRVLRVVAHRRSLNRVYEFVRRAAQQAGLDGKAVYHVEMAVDEAFSNIVDHAYADTDSGEMEVRASITSLGLVIEFRDWGRPFDPSLVPEPNLTAPLEERSLGGLGLHFIRSLMDSVDYHSGEDGNWLRMTKTLSE